MDCDLPPELEGQISINELLVEIGEPTIESRTLVVKDSEGTEFSFFVPMLPGF